MLGGVIAYDNSVKINQLISQRNLISKHIGAVSACVALQMAKGVALKLTGR